MYTKEAQPNQYTPAQPSDSTSPIHGADTVLDQKNVHDLKATVQRQSSDIELMSRELKKTQARVRELQVQLQQVMTVLRQNQSQ